MPHPVAFGAEIPLVLRCHVQGHGDTLDDIEAVVGGAVEAVSSRSGNSTLWAHEEAKIIGLPVNPLGTYLLWLLNPAFRGHDFLAGTVLVTGGADADGHTLSVGPEALAALALLAERAEQRPA